jgi:hypothetical protein
MLFCFIGPVTTIRFIAYHSGGFWSSDLGDGQGFQQVFIWQENLTPFSAVGQLQGCDNL